MVTFVDNDGAYLAWVEAAANADGYVVNSFRVPSTKYLVLHRSTCKHIRGVPPRGKVWTEGEFSKTCSQSMDELDNWAIEHLGIDKPIHRCGICLRVHDENNG